MTRSLFRTLLMALCLTALTAVPARSDSWFKFGSGKKKAAAASQAQEVDEDDADDSDDDDVVLTSGSQAADQFACECSECRRGFRDHCRFWCYRCRRPRTDCVCMDGMNGGACYPQLNSALYPSPRPNVPYEVGQTVITNQALYPHEMLYAHCYKAIYPPYYYKNTHGLACLPFYPKPCIKGTVVTVKYKTTRPCCFAIPAGANKKCFSNTQFR